LNYIYDMVQELIEKYSTRDPYELCDALGIMYRIADLGSLKGFFTLVAGEPVIIISKDIDEHQQREVCAHELGHALLHMDIAKEECLHEFEVFNMRDKTEAAANLFAAHLLIDEEQADSMLNRFADDLLTSGGRDRQGLSPVTVQAVMILLRSILEYGYKEYGLPNPSVNVSLPKAGSAEITLFTSLETARIKSAALKGNSYELGILLTLFTGLRIGELCALTWGDIDLAGQIIHINKTLYRIANPRGTSPKTVVVIDSPKSKSSVRDVPLPTFFLTALARLKRGQPDNNYFLTCSPSYTEPRSYALRYRTFLKRLNIRYRKFHSLRHTYATECIKCGVDVKSLSELLGHSSVKITLERYVHSDMELKRKELEKLWSAL